MLPNLTKEREPNRDGFFPGPRISAHPALSSIPYPPASLAEIAIILQLVTKKDCNMYTWRIKNIKAHRETFGDTGCLQFKGLIWPGVARGETKERTAPQLRFSSGKNLCFLACSEIQSIYPFQWPVHPSLSSVSRLRVGSSDKQ